MYDSHASAIFASLKLAQLAQSRQWLGQRMFEIFFTRYPETQSLFAQSDVESFGALKFKYVSDFILDSVRNPAYALGIMASEVYRHDYLDVRDQDYFNAMIDACQQAVQEALASQYTPELAEYWNESCQSAKATVQEARRKIHK